ncbi:MAG: hypothetical protein WCE79_15485 [Xanthobacteraceae bacterium]
MGYRGTEPAGRMIAMRDERSGTSLRRLLMACVCGAALALPVASHAQQAQDDEDTFEQKIIKNILGGMGVDVGRPGIDYRERSPLVIPPTRDLPPPQAAGTATSNPAWPREADRNVVVRKNKNARATPDEPGSESVLTPDELNRGINPRAPRVTDPSQNTGSIEEANIGRPMSPAQLNNKGIFNWNALMGTHLNEKAKFEAEPTRGALTQPPAGYQTPSPAYPYGTGTDKGSGWKIPNILDRAVGPDK